MNILVTGGSGYIGSSFINTFKDCYTFSTFSLQQDSLENLDLTHIDTIIHCAALVHQKNKYNSKQYHQINTEYPVKLAKIAKKHGVKQFIFLSTVAVHSLNLEYIDENSECLPNTLYGKSKLATEKKLQEIEDDHFIISIVRFPMVYGKNAPGNIQYLIKIIQKVPLLPFAKINNKRNFICIDNLLSILHKIISRKEKGIFLASDDSMISTTYLIKKISQELDKRNYLIKPLFFDILLKLFNPSLHKKLYGNLEINNRNTNKKLNYSNPFTVEECIKKMLG